MSENYASPPSKEFLDSIHPLDLKSLREKAEEVDLDDRRMRTAIGWQLDHIQDVTADPNHRLFYEQQSLGIAKKLGNSPLQNTQVINRYISIVEGREPHV
jgi:hypothetical protein